MDIGLYAGGQATPFDQQTLNFVKGANTEIQFNVNFNVYSGAVFTGNGGYVLINTNVGTVSIYDITYKIVRTHKAR